MEILSILMTILDVLEHFLNNFNTSHLTINTKNIIQNSADDWKLINVENCIRGANNLYKI